MQKRAEMIAAQLEGEIIDAGWPIGTVLGSEPELLDRFQVGRGVLREAIRLLEHHGVAEMRKGPSGGLIVKQPDGVAVRDAVALFIEFRNVSPEHLFETRRALELTCVELASARMTEAGIADLRQVLADEEAGTYPAALHVAIARASGNPSLELFVDVMAQLTALHAPEHEAPEQVASDTAHAHHAIVDAIVGGDVALARHRMLRHLEAMSSTLVPRPGRRTVWRRDGSLNADGRNDGHARAGRRRTNP